MPDYLGTPETAERRPIGRNNGSVLDVGTGSIRLFDPSQPLAQCEINVAAHPPTQPHVVGRGETLFSIARDLLGDGQRWREILHVNPGLDPASLAVGQTLQVPALATAR